MEPEHPEEATKNTARVRAKGKSTVQVGNNYNKTVNNYNGSNLSSAEQCLKALRLSDPRDEKTRIEDTKGGLHKESYEWILNHASFKRWRDDDKQRLLWIKGDAGIGKTMLLCGIVNELSREEAGVLESAKQRHFSGFSGRIAGSSMSQSSRTCYSCVSFFLCQGTDSNLNSATAVLRGLMYLLLDQQPHLQSHIQKRYDHSDGDLFKDSNAFNALSGALTEMLRDPKAKNCYIIIDALDECETDLARLLNFIHRATSELRRIKLIVSSRHRTDIEQPLSRAVSKTGQMLELDASIMSQAINIYINDRVTHLVSLGQDETLRKQIQIELQQKAHGSFLWVSLVMKQLESINKQHMMEVLQQVPEGLIPLYQDMLARIQDLADEDRRICYSIISTVTIAYRPLHLLELGALSVLPEDISYDLQGTEKAVHNCGHFISIRKNFVYFIHQSVKDFLLNKNVYGRSNHARAAAHYRLFNRSIQVLNKTLRRNVYDLKNPGIMIHEIQTPKQDPLGPIAYSCVYWVRHLHDVPMEELRSSESFHKGGPVDTFFRKKYIYWLEALGLLRKASKAIRELHNLETLLQQLDSQSLLELVRDARQFLLFNKTAIQNAPLQLYISGLLFSPKRSVIRKLFQHEAPTWDFFNMHFADWNERVQALEGHKSEITSIAISSNGLRIYSGSWDGTIKMWNSTTSHCIQTFDRRNGLIESLCFYEDSDGGRLLSCSQDGIIEVLDPLTGQCLNSIDAHIRDDIFAQYPGAPSRLFSGLAIKSMNIWDRMRRTYMSCVAFSPNGQFIAFSIKSGTIQIRKIMATQYTKTLRSQNECFSALAFSTDCQRIASGQGHRIAIWDIATGQPLQSFVLRCNPLKAIAFSPDGETITSSSLGSTSINICDITTGQCVQSLTTHSATITSLAFSPDGRKVISGSDDKTIKVSDLNIRKSGNMVEGDGSTPLVTAMSLSTDAQQMACGLENGTIQIWNIQSLGNSKTLESHEGKVLSVSFSTDDQRLASSSYSSLKVWAVVESQSIQNIDLPFGRGKNIAFLGNGTHIASMSLDRVKIWHIDSGCCIRELKVGIFSNPVSFSQEDLSISYGYADKKWIAVWEIREERRIQRLEWNRALGVRFINQRTDSGSTRNEEITELEDGFKRKKRGGQTPKRHAQLNKYKVEEDGRWITEDGRRLVWLPSYYPLRTSVVSGTVVSILLNPGYVFTIRFPSNKP